MATYYIDFLSGNDQNSGLSETEAKKSQESVKPVAGDTLLFKRGTSYQGRLSLVEGNENAPIRYGAYGEGSAPTFYGSA